VSFVIAHTLEVGAPAATVWSVITDLARYSEWNPFVVTCKSTLAVGDPIDMKVRVFPAFAQPQREQILEHVPGRLLAYGLPMRPLGELASRRSHEVTALAPDRTRYASHFELTGWLAPVVEALLGSRLRHGFTTMSAAIKTRAESL